MADDALLSISAPDTAADKPTQTTTCTLRIGGMTCAACVRSIEEGLRSQPGIESVSVALLAERGTICYKTDSDWSPEKLASEIEDMGFEAEQIKDSSEPGSVTLSVYGMTCAS